MLIPYRQAVRELEVKFQGLRQDLLQRGQHSPIESVEGRVKSVGSILEKASRKAIPQERIEAEIEDIAGVRILCRFVEDIERVAQLVRAREGLDLTVTDERDYVAHTKASGYRSYHMLVKYGLITAEGRQEVSCEIQIRTLAMNFWATIEHSLNYKYSQNIPPELRERLISSAEAAFLLDNEMSAIRDEILEAQRVILRKNELVDEILAQIRSLYTVARLDAIDDLNREFLELYQSGDLAKLQDFNERLEMLAEVYQARE